MAPAQPTSRSSGLKVTSGQPSSRSSGLKGAAGQPSSRSSGLKVASGQPTRRPSGLKGAGPAADSPTFRAEGLSPELSTSLSSGLKEAVRAADQLILGTEGSRQSSRPAHPRD